MASCLERLDEFGKRLDMSLARRSENEEMLKEIEKLLEEKSAIDGAPDYGEQEEFDQEELDYFQYEFGADGMRMNNPGFSHSGFLQNVLFINF